MYTTENNDLNCIHVNSLLMKSKVYYVTAIHNDRYQFW